MTVSRLIGIARHARPRGPMEVLESVAITIAGGLDGDFRGAVKPGGRGRRQVSLLEVNHWDAAMAELGVDHHWSARRANLLVEHFALPREPRNRVCIGDEVVIEITQECDPCSRLEQVEPGLKAALSPDWRGGALGRVIAGGTIIVGDRIRIGDG